MKAKKFTVNERIAVLEKAFLVMTKELSQIGLMIGNLNKQINKENGIQKEQ
jgi:hypothetical protein